MKIENKKQKNRKTQKIVISLCLLRPCLLRVLWCSVCFCTGHFVIVPINLTCPHCLQHFFFEHLLHLYYPVTYFKISSYLYFIIILTCFQLLGKKCCKHSRISFEQPSYILTYWLTIGCLYASSEKNTHFSFPDD